MKFGRLSNSLTPICCPHNFVKIYNLHAKVKFIVMTLEHSKNKREQLLFCQFSSCKDIFKLTEIGLNLLLQVLVHTELTLGFGTALHEGFDLGNIDCDLLIFDLILNLVLLLNGARKGCGHFITSVQKLLISCLEPFTGGSVLCHVLPDCWDGDLVIVVKYIEFLENTGHVANLLICSLLLSLEFSLKSVPKIQVGKRMTDGLSLLNIIKYL